MFREIDLLTRKERGAAVVEVSRASQRDEMGEGGITHPVLGIVEQQVVEAQLVAGEAVGVLGKEVRDRPVADLHPMGFQGSKG